jgi:S-methylmethionine-dependent homocysteine/selenocysteine methylase
MAKYRNQLPQLSGDFFITDGGLETTLIYHENIELPCFASFIVLKDESGCQLLRNYLGKYVDIARKYNVGLLLESATWRAHPDCVQTLDYSEDDVINFNRKSIELLGDIRDQFETEKCPMVINACIGPRGDGYNPTVIMSPEQAQAYHAIQIGVFSQTKADMISAMTLNYPEEAIGIARAAKEVGMPVAISFTVEQDGKLATGQTVKEAIQLVDKATDNTPAYYMINCAHPSHFTHVLLPEEDWVRRIRGVECNASKKSHAELDESKELDAGNPVEFGTDNRALLYKLKNLNVFGGCCGTDYRHIEEICKACIPVFDQLKHSRND